MTRRALILCLCAGAGAAQDYPPPFPREAARKLFENERVAVWDVTWPKGHPTAMHRHPVDQLSVTVTGGQVRVTRPGGTQSVGKSEPGSVVFTPTGTIHMEEGISDVPQRKIMLQLKPGGGVPGGSGWIPAEGAVKLLENARVIAWSYRLKPGERLTRKADSPDAVVVLVDRGEASYARRGEEAAVRGPGRTVIVELK